VCVRKIAIEFLLCETQLCEDKIVQHIRTEEKNGERRRAIRENGEGGACNMQFVLKSADTHTIQRLKP